MSVLTRIKNNQITDSTILANTKIAPGSIVGSLFNSNLTMTSDVTITGNLTVQGSSTYLTLASTNTFVNDPLIVMNNAFTGTNTNDIGLLFNRGSDTNQAFIWDESEDEFRLIATSETGETYGNVTTSNFANIRVGNLTVEGAATIGSLSTTGDIGAVNLTLSGDAAVNGGDLTTTATTFNLVNANATTVNFAGDATTLELGAATGTTNINNNLDVDGNISVDGENLTVSATTFNLVNTTATTVNAFGAATTLTLGAESGTLTVRNALLDVDGNATVGGTLGVTGDTTLTGDLSVNGGDITTTATTFNLIDTTATSVNAFGDATAIDLGATTGTLTINNPTVVGTQTTQNLYNTTATTVNFAGAATTLTVGATSGTLTVRNALLDIAGNATVGGTLGVTGDTTVTGDLAVNGGDITTTASTFNLLTANATTVNAFTAANTLEIGAEGTGTSLKINSGIVYGADTSQDLYNTTATTLNFAGAATTLIVGATSGVANIRNATTNIIGNATVGGTLDVTGAVTLTDDLTLTGNLAVNGGDLTTTAATFNLADANATSVNAFGAATAIDLGATTGTLTINNPTVVGTQTTQDLYNTTATTLNFAGAATTLSIGAATGTATINNDTVNLEGNVNVNQTTPSTNSTTGALVVDGGVGIAGNLNIGENLVVTGNLTVQGAVTTLNTATLDVEDINITVAKGAIDSAAADGAGLTVDGANATLLYNHATTSWDLNKTTRVTDTTDTTDENSGALRVAGGVAIAKDLFVGGGDIITDETTFNLLDATVTTLNIGGAATAIDLGATTGTLTINNPTVVGTQTTQDLYNTTATTVNFAGAATTLTIGAATGVANLRNATTNILGNAIVGGTMGVTGAVTLTDDLAVNGGDITTTATTATVFNTNATTVDAFGAATDLEFGATTGTLTINNPTVVGTQTTQNLYNTTATTVNFAGAATALNIGAATGTASLLNANIWLPNATEINSGQLSANLFTLVTQTANLLTTASSINFGRISGTLTINNPTVVGSQTTQNLYNTTATTLNFAGDATSVTAGASSGTFSLRNANLHLPNATTIHSSQSTVALLNENVTTVNGFGNTTALTLGATTGTASIQNATLSLPNATNIHVDQTSITVANVNATTVNAFGAATELNLAAEGGNTSIRGNVISNGILVITAGIPTTSPTIDPADGTTSFFVLGGSVLQGNVFITEEANISYANIYDTRISSSSSTGALTVQGGVGLGANLNVSGGTVINIDQTAEPFRVKGQFATTLIYADSVTDTVTIGGSNTTPISGATLRVNGTGAMILPVGTTGQRPGTTGNVDVDGMIRINSSLNILEYYANDSWQSSQGSFTVITSESFSGNGVATVFTMAGSATTSSTIVSINGIVQIPATSYSITDDVLTFTEAPEVGDTIDVRRLTTTVSVDELGFNQNIFKANIDYAYISTGTVGSVERLLIDDTGLVTVTGNMEIYGNLTVNGGTAGQINIGDSTDDNVAITAEINSNLVPNTNNTFDLGSPTQRWRDVYSHATVHDQTPTNVDASATPTLIDSFSTSTYSSAKYLVQVKDGSDIQAAELLLVQDTTNAFIVTYGVLSSNVELGEFTANISSGNVNLFYTSTIATNSNVKVHTTYIV